MQDALIKSLNMALDELAADNTRRMLQIRCELDDGKRRCLRAESAMLRIMRLCESFVWYCVVQYFYPVCPTV
jgi:hypothetical protein